MARINFEFISKNLVRRLEVNLYIPSLSLNQTLKNDNKEYYQETQKKYPLMILLSGFSESNKAWQANSHIEELCEQNQVAAAFVGGENRWYLNLGPLDNWYDLIEYDLLDYLYGTFSNLGHMKPLIIGGVSMGGYGALYHGLKNPHKYSAILALSPSTKPDFIDETKIGSLRDLFMENKHQLPPVYLSVGTKDFIIESSKQLDNWLSENEIGINYRFIQDYDHSWRLWRNELDAFFKFLHENKIIN